jgi:hypothetical protein
VGAPPCTVGSLASQVTTQIASSRSQTSGCTGTGPAVAAMSRPLDRRPCQPAERRRRSARAVRCLDHTSNRGSVHRRKLASQSG